MNQIKPTGQLFIVATPIGHLQDISFRAVSTLKEVDLILAEDTRVTQRLLAHYLIETPISAFHEHNESKRLKGILEKLSAGMKIALVTDAGTPLISDPGYQLVRESHRLGINISPIPGASAVIAAMSVSGIPCDRFTFYGFFPRQNKAQQAVLHAIAESSWTSVIYEAPTRIARLIALLPDFISLDREVVIGRELTKQFESIRFGTLAEITQLFTSNEEPEKGEFVVLIAGKIKTVPTSLSSEQRDLLTILLTELPPKQACRLMHQSTGISQRILYEESLKLKHQ